MNIAILTSSDLPQLSDDDRPLIALFAEQNVTAKPLVWNEDLGEKFDAILVRTPWDYHLQPKEFFAWFKSRSSKGTRFFNSARLIEWNSHKFYLREMAKSGLPVVETIGAGPAESTADAFEAARERGWKTWVVKPAVSASAHETRRVDPSNSSDLAWAEALAAREDILIQPFIEEVATRGELSLVVINGEVSHAYLKRPKAGDFRVQVEFGGSIEPLPVAAWQQQTAQLFLEQALELSGESEVPLYARVDLLPGAGSSWQLGELELFEPALQFELRPAARTLLVDEVVRRLSK